MLNEKAEKIKNVLFEKTEQNLEKYRDFHFGEFIEKPNQCGYFERNGNWYTYVIDERNFCTFTGPFNGSAIYMRVPRYYIFQNCSKNINLQNRN